ncbi:MAG: hypothetical protein AAGG53_07890 [Cyanobacteria bacterium P01_H01_bin.152]
MIPEACRLDIFIDDRNPKLRILVEAFLAQCSRIAPLQILGNGYALHYKNIMAAGHPRLVQDIVTALNKYEGVYVNENPLELQAELDTDMASMLE